MAFVRGGDGLCAGLLVHVVAPRAMGSQPPYDAAGFNLLNPAVPVVSPFDQLVVVRRSRAEILRRKLETLAQIAGAVELRSHVI